MSSEVTTTRFFIKHTVAGSLLIGLAFFILVCASKFVNISSLFAPFMGKTGYFTASSCELKTEGRRGKHGMWVCEGTFYGDDGQQTSVTHYIAAGTKGTEYYATIPKDEIIDPFEAQSFPTEVKRVFPWSNYVDDARGYIVYWSYAFVVFSLVLSTFMFAVLRANRSELQKIVDKGSHKKASRK